MNTKLIISLCLCGLFALSPAPIKDLEGAKHVLPFQSAAQVKAEQKYNGVLGEVGTVTLNKKADDDSNQIQSDSKAASVIASAPVSSETAAQNIHIASKRLKLEKDGKTSPIWLGLIVLAIVAALLFIAKNVLERVGPAPERLKALEKLS